MFLPTPHEQPVRGQIQLVGNVILKSVPREYAVLQIATGYILSVHDKANDEWCEQLRRLLAEFWQPDHQ